MKYIFLFLLILTGVFSISTTTQKMQGPMQTENIVNEDTSNFILTREKLNDSLKYPWFKKAYEEYYPEALNLNYIRDERKGLRFVIIGGSWCDDTHMWLPRFLKTIERAGVKKKNIEIFGVNREKKFAGNTEDKTAPEETFMVDRVPLFIVYYKDREIGRIVESVRHSVEADIVAILQEAEFQKKL